MQENNFQYVNVKHITIAKYHISSYNVLCSWSLVVPYSNSVSAFAEPMLKGTIFTKFGNCESFVHGIAS